MACSSLRRKRSGLEEKQGEKLEKLRRRKKKPAAFHQR